MLTWKAVSSEVYIDGDINHAYWYSTNNHILSGWIADVTGGGGNIYFGQATRGNTICANLPDLTSDPTTITDLGRPTAGASATITPNTVTLPNGDSAYSTLPLGLVAYYGLKEGAGTVATDWSSFQDNGAIENSTAWTTTYYGSALSFVTASQNWVNIPTVQTHLVGIPKAMSVTFSATAVTSAAEREIVCLSDRWFSIYLTAGGEIRFHYVNATADNDLGTGVTVVAGEIYTVEVQSTGQGQQIWVSTTGLKGSDSLAGRNGGLLSDNAIGADNEGSLVRYYFAGIIYRVEIWNRALSPTEIFYDAHATLLNR